MKTAKQKIKCHQHTTKDKRKVTKRGRLAFDNFIWDNGTDTFVDLLKLLHLNLTPPKTSYA